MSTQQTRKLFLQNFLPYRLSIMANKISNNFSKAYRESFDLTTMEWRVLAVLGQSDTLSADDICKLTETDKVAVSRAVMGLIKKRRVRRTFSRQDRRRSILRLSKLGRSVYEEIVPIVLEMEARLIAPLSPREEKQLRSLLDKIKVQADLI